MMIDPAFNRLAAAPSFIGGRIELTGARAGALSQAYGRIVIISIVFALIYLVVAIRIFDLMILQGALRNFQDTGGGTGPLVSTVSLPRGDITDRNGVLLATSIKTASLYADPKTIMDPVQTAKDLTKIFPDLAYGETLQKLQSEKRFVWIKRNLNPEEQAAVLELGQPGLAFQQEYKRLYPQGELAAHVVGYSGVDGEGLAGIEQGFNSLLKKGSDTPLKLTMDIRLQHILRRETEKAIDDFTAVGGTGIILDIKNGDVLAAVSLPDFDPHLAGTAKDAQRFNRATLGVYELGSVFKIFSTAAYLELKKGTFGKTFDAVEPIKVGRFTISDFHPEKRPLTLPEVFMYSSNIGTGRMAQDVGPDNLKNFYADLGLLTPMAFDLPESGRPLYAQPWGEIATLTASYGHGIAVTPLQAVAATATLIGDGTRVKPRLVMGGPEKTETVAQVVSPDTVKKMRQLMRLVVTHGTAEKADVKGLMVGGKTGTAEKNLHGRYVHNRLVSSFVGAFPMNDPRYVVLVSVDEPKPNKNSYGYATAGWVAAPPMARIAEGIAAVTGMEPVAMGTRDVSAPLEIYLTDTKDKHKKVDQPSAGVHPVASLASDVAR